MITDDMYIEESSFFSKIRIPGKVRKYNKQLGVKISNMEDLLKVGKNPGLEKYVQECNDIEELEYLRKDANNSIPTLEKIKERIGICKSKGECKQTAGYYKYIKKHYIDQGITESQVAKAISNLKRLCSEISAKIRKLKSEKYKNESTFLEAAMDFSDNIMTKLF